MKHIALIGTVFFLLLGLRASPISTDVEITWYSLEEAQKLAKENEKKVLIYAEASWCGYCKKMEKQVFPQEAVVNTMVKYFYPVRLDVESEEEVIFNGEEMTMRHFAGKHRVTGTPTFFFIDKEGKILGAQPGFIPADVFKKLLAYVGSEAYSRLEFNEYMKESEND